MELILWRDTFSVGNSRIDNQHKHLVQLINKLFNNLAAKDKDDLMRKIFNELVDYTKNHFSMEEMLMQELKHPNYMAHKDEHSQFIIKIGVLREKYLKGEMKVNLETLNFLKDWLLNHIIGTDKKTFGN